MRTNLENERVGDGNHLSRLVRNIRGILGCLLVATASGCAAIGTRESDGAGHYFAGVRDDAYYLAHPSEADYPELQPLNILDLPFSFTVDLVCWPYDFDVNHTKHAGPAPADRFF